MKPGAHRGRRSPARLCWYSDCVPLSGELQLGRKNKHRLNLILQSRTTHIDSYILEFCRWRPDRARACFPRVSSHTGRQGTKNVDRAPRNPPSARQHPLRPATAPGTPAVPCSEYTHAHKAKAEKREKEPKMPRKIEKTKNRWKGPASNKRRRFPSGSSERPRMYQRSTHRVRYP